MKQFTKKQMKEVDQLTDEYIMEFLRESNAIERVYEDEMFEQAYKAWKHLMRQKFLTKKSVLWTHRILMKYSDLLPKYKGAFRDCPVYIGGREAPSHFSIWHKMDDWIEGMNEEILGGSDLERISKELHVEFERIHPWADGNGRTGRMFMNWWRLKNGSPLLIIKDSEKLDYYQWFKE